jgi:hypothetical protein
MREWPLEKVVGLRPVEGANGKTCNFFFVSLFLRSQVLHRSSLELYQYPMYTQMDKSKIFL